MPAVNATRAMSQQAAIAIAAECMVTEKRRGSGATRQKPAIAQYVSGWKTYGFSFGSSKVRDAPTGSG